MTYPNSTGFQKNSVTSEESARMLDETGAADSQAAWILGYLKSHEPDGATADELTIAMQESDFPKIHNGTVAGRLVHLERLFQVKKSDITRKTSSGRNAVVFVPHDGTPYDIPKTKREQAKEDLQMCAGFIGALIDAKKITDGNFAERAPFIKATLDRLIKDIPA